VPPLVSTVRAMWERAFYRRTTLGHLLENPGDDSGSPLTASATPVSFEVRAPARAILQVYAAVDGDADARARCEIAVVSGAPPRSRVLDLTSADGWRCLRLRLGAPPGRIVRVELRATAADSRTPAPAVRWREPALRWRRTAADIWRSFLVGVSTHGVQGLISRTQSATVSLDRRRRDFDTWRRRQTPDPAALARMASDAASLSTRPAFAVLVHAGATGPVALARTLASLERQVYRQWEAYLCGVDSGTDNSSRVHRATGGDDASARNDAIARTAADFVLSVAAGDELAPHALFEVARALNDDPRADVVYSDEALIGADGAVMPRFKPDWSPEYLLARMYVGRLLVLRRTAVRAAGGYRAGLDGAADYDLLLRVTAPCRREAPRVVHLAQVLYEGRTRDVGEEAERRVLADFCRSQAVEAIVSRGAVRGVWRVQRQLRERPAVTLVIPTQGRVGDTPAGRQPLVAYCVRSLLERTNYERFEILVVDTGRLTPDAEDALADARCRRLHHDATGPFNFSRTINVAVTATATPVVVLLNDDVEPIDADWLSAMLEYALQERIGAVGAKLFYPDGRLQHVGVATGVCGVAAHLLHQHSGGSLACDGIAASVRNCAAVTGACLMTRRAVYDEVGGFDERLATDFNDVDFCLRARRAGYRIVYTPYARLYHHESATFGPRRQQPGDVEQVRRTWGDALMHDPYYNANLSRAYADCRLDV